MVNKSKLNQQRWQLKWYLSGAIRWQPELPGGSRIIGIVQHCKFDKIFHDIAVCKAVLSSDGQRLSFNLNGGSCCFVVPANTNHVFGAPIEKIPGNAIPVDIFFGKD